MTRPVDLVLLHYPVTNRHGEVVTTSVTNMDIHDISRSARTYGIRNFTILTPIEDQHALVSRILDHWQTERSLEHHPARVEAVSKVKLARNFGEVLAGAGNTRPKVVLTSASDIARTHPVLEGRGIDYRDLRKSLEDPGHSSQSLLLVFGTGWGVAEEFYPEVDRVLRPLRGSSPYNHLSVRAAVAIVLDRLFGEAERA